MRGRYLCGFYVLCVRGPGFTVRESDEPDDRQDGVPRESTQGVYGALDIGGSSTEERYKITVIQLREATFCTSGTPFPHPSSFGKAHTLVVQLESADSLLCAERTLR